MCYDALNTDDVFKHLVQLKESARGFQAAGATTQADQLAAFLEHTSKLSNTALARSKVSHGSALLGSLFPLKHYQGLI